MPFLASLSQNLENSTAVGDYYDERPIETIRVDPLVAWADLPEDLQSERFLAELEADSTQDPTKSWADLLNECDPASFSEIRNQIRTEAVRFFADNESARFDRIMNEANAKDAIWELRR